MRNTVLFCCLLLGPTIVGAEPPQRRDEPASGAEPETAAEFAARS